MKSNALYYPYIDVPNEKWLLQTFLYWDKVISIVPMEYAYQPEKHSGFMRRLLEHELVEPVFPAQYVRHKRLEEYADSLERALSSESRRRRLLSGGFVSDIHVEKLQGISERLIALGAAEASDGYWVRMPKQIANHFMAFIAREISNCEGVDADPITSKLFGPKFNVASERNRIRKDLLGFLFPLPDQQISVEELATFKLHNGDLLQRFRHFVEKEVDTIRGAVQADGDYEGVLERALASMGDKVEEIKDVLKGSWKNITYKYVVPIVGAGGTYAFPPAAPLFALGGAVGPMLARNADIINEPLAYSVFAQEEVLSKRSFSPRLFK